MGPWKNEVLLGDCLELMETLPSGKVDCVLTDLPYGTTDNKWDSVLSMDRLWELWRRLTKSGAPFILFTQQPFTTTVAASNLRRLKTEWIWEKNRGTGFLNAKKYPLKSHENILVFCDRLPPYYPQMMTGFAPYKSHKKANASTNYHTDGEWSSVNTDGTRYPKTVLNYDITSGPKGERGLHPTQKPIALVEYLIRTYTRPGQLILDCCAGSGTTLAAAVNTGRSFVGIERDPGYHATAQRRVAAAQKAKHDEGTNTNAHSST